MTADEWRTHHRTHQRWPRNDASAANPRSGTFQGSGPTCIGATLLHHCYDTLRAVAPTVSIVPLFSAKRCSTEVLVGDICHSGSVPAQKSLPGTPSNVALPPSAASLPIDMRAN